MASARHDDPGRALVERLWVEVRRAQGDPARRARLLARLLALDPEHVPARLDQAALDGDAPALDRLARGHPQLVEVRRAHLRARLAGGAPGDLDAADLPLLAGLDPDERLRAAVALVEAGRVDAALDLLRAALEAEPRHLPSLRALAQVAAARGDDATVAAAERARAETEAARRHEAAVRRAAVPGDTRLVEARDALDLWRRHLEHDAEYLLRVAQYENNSARPGQSVLAAGRYLLVARGMPAYRVSYWTYAFGHVEVSLEGETVLDVVARERPARPDDAALFAAEALYLLARHHSTGARPGDALAAADAALRAVDLSPGSPSLLALAADAAIEADEAAEAAPLLRRALALDPGAPYAVFQQARLAARAGDADLAVRLLEASGRPDFYDVAGYTFAKDACFAPVREAPRFKQYLSR
ncbi:MAG: hypothetical protein M9894_09195 [Planctomycetes bacterium]|nr:hypothetical protein [Planctomycetota bacterium]